MSISVRLQALANGTAQHRLANWSALLPKIEGYEPELEKLTDYELRKRSLSLRYRAKSQEPLEKLLPEAFALVR